MKHAVALGVGVAMIFAALILASGTMTQGNAPQAEVAREWATALHTTLSPLPTGTPPSASTPTPIRVTRVDDDIAEILAMLFQNSNTPPYFSIAHVQVAVQDYVLRRPIAPALVLAGDGLEATDGHRSFAASFGAVLVWTQGEYVVRFKHVEFGRGHLTVSMWTTPERGEIGFLFRNAGLDVRQDIEFRRLFVLDCNVKACAVVRGSPGTGS